MYCIGTYQKKKKKCTNKSLKITENQFIDLYYTQLKTLGVFKQGR